MTKDAQTARDVIALEISDQCNSVSWERGKISSTDVADAIIAALKEPGHE